MKNWLALLTISSFALTATSGGAEQDARRSFYVELSDSQSWALQTEGDYHCRYDARDLYCMYHLYSTAAGNDQAALSTTVTIPADWQPPVGLELFCSDDYQVPEDRKPTDSWMACHAYPHHRFKQILVDEKVVWESDVADVGITGQVAVDLSAHVRPGQTCKLTLRMIDKVGTELTTDGEHFWAGGFTPGSWKPTTDPRAFPTHVYWGDLLLTERFDAEGLHPLRDMASVRRLRERVARDELNHRPDGAVPPPGQLHLEAPAGAPVGWPLGCGVLLPAGAVTDARQIELADAGERPIPAQREAISWWPDGSLRAARVSFPVPDGLGPGDPISLTWSAAASPALPPGVSIDRQSDHLVVRNNLISLHFSRAGEVAIQQVRDSQSELLAGSMRFYLESSDDDGTTTRYDAVWREPEILSDGPRQVVIRINGTLIAPLPDGGDDNADGQLGRCTLRLALTDDSPLVRLWLRVHNDTPRQLNVTRMVVAQIVPSGTSRGEVATLEKPNGWFAADCSEASIFAAVRWAAEMPTKRLARADERLAIELFTPTEEVPFYSPRSGEAHRTELVLGYYNRKPTDDELQAVAAAVQRPPRLWNSRWACTTAALGPGDIHDDTLYPQLTDNRRRAYGDLQREKTGHVHYNMRDFGDRRYGTDQWSNNYYDGIRGYLAEYLMTGNPQAFDRAAEAVAHAINVDQCHWWPEEAMVGGIWTYSGNDHSDGGYHWAPLQRTAAGLAYYYRLTGDPDVLEALRMMADYAVTRNTGYQSVRDHGGILTALVWAYDELRDEQYLHAALETMAEVQTRRSARRGPYLEPNGNWSFLVSIPWMAAELADAHYQLWKLTGNEEAATVALGMADSLIQENGTWGVPGEMGGYSGYPHFRMTSNYNIILAPVIATGYELTSDPKFLLWARSCFERTLAENSVDSLTNNYWLTPRLLYLLTRHRDVETTMPSPPAVRVPPNFGEPLKQ